MENIYDYIEKHGNEELNEINEVDALIFTRLSYIHIEELRNKLPFNIVDLKNYLHLIKVSVKDKKLVELLSKAKRYKDLVIDNCYNVFNPNEVIQFCAINILLSNNDAFIAFRGTDKSIVGLMEDIDMSYKDVPSEICGSLYLNDMKKYRKLYLGGHSKGGSVAIYAFLNANLLTKRRVKRVYNFDGPGLLNMKQSVFIGRIINFYPNTSIIGRMLNRVGEYRVIKSKYGLEGHNIYNWEIDNNKLKRSSFTSKSNEFYDANKRLLSKISKERRERIISYFYNIMSKRNINLRDFKWQDLKDIIDEMTDITKEEREELLNYLKVFIKVSMPKIEKIENKRI